MMLVLPRLRALAASLILAIPLAFAYGSVLVSLAGQWLEDPNYTHGFFVPLMALWLAGRRYRRFLDTPRTLDPTGIVVVAAGVILYLAGVLAAELFTTRVSLVIVVAGLVLAFEGRQRLRVMAFPIAFLLCMVPLPYVLYYRLTFPLQLASSRIASDLLSMAGLPVLREGNVLHLEGYSLEVVAACSGLRSIMALGTIGVFLMDLVPMSRAGRIVYLLLLVPVAMGANVARLVFTAAVAAISGPETAESFLHGVSGIVLFVSGLLAMLAIAAVIRWTERRHG